MGFIRQAASGLRRAASGAANNVRRAASGAANNVRRAASGAARNVNRATSSFTRGASRAVSQATRGARRTLSSVSRNVRSAASGAAGQARRATASARRNVSRSFQGARQQVGSTLTRSTRGVRRAVSSTARTAQRTFSNVTRGARRTASTAARNVNRSFQGVRRQVGGTLSRATRGVTRRTAQLGQQVSRTTSRAARGAQRTLSTVSRNTQRTLSNASGNARRAATSASRNVNRAASNAARNVSSNVNRAAANAVRNVRGGVSQAARNTVSTAQRLSARASSATSNAARATLRNYHRTITQSYQDAQVLSRSSNPLERAVGRSSVAVRDGVANLNRTVDESVQFWKGVGGPAGRVGEFLASTGKGITAPLRAVDHTATNAQRNGALLETGAELVTGGMGRLAGPALRGLARTPVGKATVRQLTRLGNSSTGRRVANQLSRLGRTAGRVNSAPARALGRSRAGQALLRNERRVRQTLSTVNRFGDGKLGNAARRTLSALRERPLVEVNINRGNNRTIQQRVLDDRVRVGGNLEAGNVTQTARVGGRGRLNININSFNDNTVDQRVLGGRIRVGGDLDVKGVRQQVQVGSGGVDININSLRNLRVNQQVGGGTLRVGGQRNVRNVEQSVSGNLPPGAQVRQSGPQVPTRPLQRAGADTVTSTAQRVDSGSTLPRLPPATEPTDPLVRWHARPRAERMRAPEPLTWKGQRYDVAGMTRDGKVRLERADVRSRNLQREELYNGTRKVSYQGQEYTLKGTDSSTDWGGSAKHFVLEGNGQQVKVPLDRAEDITFRFNKGGGEYSLGAMRHGVIKLNPTAAADVVEVPAHSLGRFQARLKGRELEGVYELSPGAGGKLQATGVDRQGVQRTFEVTPDQVAGRYVDVDSPDFGTSFKVDAFAKAEADARSTSVRTGGPLPVSDPALGSLPSTVRSHMDAGRTSLRRMEELLRDPTVKGDVDVFNIAFNDGGEARAITDALLDYRKRNPDARMRIVAYEPSWGSFPNHQELSRKLADARIDVQFPPRQTTRQVIHAKGIAAGDRVLFSTAAVIDKTTKKLDVSTPLPPEAARTFKRYLDVAMNEGTPQARQQLLAELAQQGVLVNDPIARVPYTARAMDALISGATKSLRFTGSELRDVNTTRKLIDLAARKVDVHIQFREMDAVSRQLLGDAQKLYPNLRVEDVNDWAPYPHFNLVAADGQQAYVGTAYLWSNQLNMVQHGISYENGVLMGPEATKDLLRQLEDLAAQERLRKATP
jgi:hypothetical protein